MKKLHVLKILAFALIAMASSTTLRAQILAVDFQFYSTTPQSGFESMSIPGDSGGSVSSSFADNNFTVTVAAGKLSNNSDIQSFSGYGGSPAGPYDTLYEGYWSGSGQPDLRVEVDGLSDDTTYNITFQSFNQYAGSGTGFVHTLSSLNDSIGSYVGQVNTLTGGYPGAPYPTSLTPGANGNGYYTFTATSNDNGSLFFADSVYNSSGNSTGTFIEMNGFEVSDATTIPEPSSSGLLALGAGLLSTIYIFRRRKLSA